MTTIKSKTAPRARVREMVLDLPEPQYHPRRDPEVPPITTRPERLGGASTIAGSRLPVNVLFDEGVPLAIQ